MTLIVAIFNVTSAARPVNATPADPWLEVKPNYYMTKSMETFNVSVLLNDITPDKRLVGVQFGLSYNTTLLEVVAVTEGPFLKNTTWAPFGTLFTYFIEPDGVYGPHVLVSDLILPNATGHWNVFPNGAGLTEPEREIATITFRGIYPQGTCALVLIRVELTDDKANAITTAPSKDGYYDIWPLLSDVNRDKRVDIRDVVFLARAFGSIVGDSRWNPRYDLVLREDNLYRDRNGANERTDIRDVTESIVKSEFGKSIP